MQYCTKCGNPITNPAKFCTSCGTPLDKTLSTHPTATTPVAAPKAKFNSWYVIIPAFIIIAGAAVYLLIIKKNDTVVSTETVLPFPDKTAPSQAIIVDTQTAEDSYPEQITQAEEATLRNTITGFYQSENDQDVPRLLGYYEFPIIRYYELNYVSYENLEKMVNDAFNGNLFYHNMEINWNSSWFEKVNSILYRVYLSGIYSSGNRTDENPKRNNLNLVIELNSSFKITSIFKNPN